jgi:menaquinone-dependent protoporphyrinogen oxidase
LWSLGRVLVAFATKHGSTGEIARTIGAGLSEAGLEVDVLPVAQVERIDDYQAVVMGCGVYMNRGLKPGMDFLKRFRTTLPTRHIWLFSSGPTGGTEDADSSVGAAAAMRLRRRRRMASASGWIGSAAVAT